MMNATDLRDKRIRYGFKQCELAMEAGVPGNRLCAAENGYLSVRPDELEALDLALHVMVKRRLAT